MKLVAAVVFIFFAFSSAQSEPTKAVAFLKSSEQCFKQLKVPSSYAAKFEKFNYPDEPIVHDFLHCLWLDLGYWNDKTGTDVDRILYTYRTEGNADVADTIISDCNRNEQNDLPPKWVYQSFQCLLNTPGLGIWFKEYITKAKV